MKAKPLKQKTLPKTAANDQCMQPIVVERPLVVDPDGTKWYSYQLVFDRNADTGIPYPSGPMYAYCELSQPFTPTESSYYVIGMECDPIAILPIYNGQPMEVIDNRSTH